MNIEKTTPIRLSKWTHIFRKDGLADFALFHALNIETVFLQERLQSLVEFLGHGTTIAHLVRRLSAVSSEDEIAQIITHLASIGIVVGMSEDDQAQLEAVKDAHFRQVGLETLYLLVTDQCNLRCRYCLVHRNMRPDYTRSMMGWDVARTCIDMYFRNLERNGPQDADYKKMIIFYGGEPFLNFPIIKQAVEYVEREYAPVLTALGDRFGFLIITNGTKVTEEIAVFVRDHRRIAVSISIDGPQEIHDTQRVTVSQCGSFGDVIRGYELLKTVGQRENIAVSCTIGPHNVDHLEELLAMQKKYGFSSISFNPPLDGPDDLVSDEFAHKVSERMIQFFEKAREQGVYEDRFMRKVRCFTDMRVHPFDCQALGAQIVCAPDGAIGVCHEDVGTRKFFFGKASRSFRFHDEPTVQQWKRRSPLNMPQCQSCPAIGICGGGCAYSALLRNGNIFAIDDRFCIHSLKSLEWIIWDLYTRA